MTTIEKPVALVYRVVVNLQELCQCNSKRGAVKALWDAIQEGIKNRTISNYQQLETTCWVEEAGRYLFSFYEARDYAYNAGWVVEGKWLEIKKSE